MSLSPLYPAQTSDLHVSTVEDPPSEFLPTSVHPGIDHHLSGLIIHALAPIPRPRPIQERYPMKIAFASRYSLHMNHTCMYDKLRGPCFKTGGLTAFLIIVLPNSRGRKLHEDDFQSQTKGTQKVRFCIQKRLPRRASAYCRKSFLQCKPASRGEPIPKDRPCWWKRKE